MIQGYFIEELPAFEITVAWKEGIEHARVILDTGFSGDLQLSPSLVDKLGLRASDVTSATLANGERFKIPTTIAIAAMEGSGKPVHILISDSTPLAGIGFLSKFGYKAIVDCKHKKVTLQKA